MKMYAKIINNDTGLCMVGSGNNTAQYRSMAMTPLDVQQSDVDGQWYLKSKCPMKSAEEKEQEERERLDGLMMTRGDVFEALILAKGLGKAQLRGMIDAYEVDEVTKALYLNRFDEALNFYRGYPIFDLLGEVVGITSEMWDRFFESKDYRYLTTCKLTINPTPEDSTVTITPNPVPYGEIAHYRVECEGYQAVEGDVVVVEDEVFDVVLEEA